MAYSWKIKEKILEYYIVTLQLIIIKIKTKTPETF